MTWRNLFLTLCVFGILISGALATPPRAIHLDYDPAKKVLSFSIDHVSSNIDKHHIRRVEVYKNDQLIHEMTLTFQKPQGVIEELSLDAKAKDVIRVKAICNQAGYLEETLLIPENKKDKPPESQTSPEQSSVSSQENY